MRRANLSARHHERVICRGLYVLGHERTREAGPAGSGFELVARAEQRLAGHDVHVDPFLVVVPVLVLERRFGAFVLRDLVLHRRELLLELRVRGLLERFHGLVISLGGGCGGRCTLCSSRSGKRSGTENERERQRFHVRCSVRVREVYVATGRLVLSATSLRPAPMATASSRRSRQRAA